MRLRFAVAFFILVGADPAAAADAIRLGLPVECKMGTVCFIQNYVDQDPSSAETDYRCNSLSYNGHKGSDFRLRDFVDMQRGVAVIAAAAGTVRATRDTMPDVSVRQVGVAALLGNDAGNGVLIDHEDGWQTQYSHLRRRSIAVKAGLRVKRGQRLGLIGLSGKTEFPHLHLSVRLNGKVVDPFTGLAAPGGCEAKGTPLWRDDVSGAVAYLPSTVLVAGFADHQLPHSAAQHGLYPRKKIAANAAAVVFWIEVMGPQSGDREEFRLVGPDGKILFEKVETLKKVQAVRYRLGGIKRKGTVLRAGRYVGEYRLLRLRDGQMVPAAETSRTIQVQ
jgi:hypothetical protein